MGECEKECMGAKGKNAEFERLGGEQILGYEKQTDTRVPWKLLSHCPSLWGSCL